MDLCLNQSQLLIPLDISSQDGAAGHFGWTTELKDDAATTHDTLGPTLDEKFHILMEAKNTQGRAANYDDSFIKGSHYIVRTLSTTTSNNGQTICFSEKSGCSKPQLKISALSYRDMEGHNRIYEPLWCTQLRICKVMWRNCFKVWIQCPKKSGQ